MVQNIEHDVSRFKQIVRGKIRQNLKKYVTQGEMIGRKGKNLVSIPLSQLDVPHFRYGNSGSGGVGQGEGEDGQPVAGGDGKGGAGKAGDSPGGHILEVDVSLEELADILGEELQLPRIQPKGRSHLEQVKNKYTGVRRTGPESLRHLRRTYKEALRRQISAHEYNPLAPKVTPIREDKRYRSWKPVLQPEANAAIVYMMDVSGSMADEQKSIVRTEAFWIDAWLRRHYKGIERRYIIHDAVAKVVDEETFYHTRESGGTRISTAYKLFLDVIAKEFNPTDWNIYGFHFSDGDNWGDDNTACFELLSKDILPKVNLFCYGQVESPYGSGEFLPALRNRLGKSAKNLVLSEIPNREAIYASIKTFLGRGV